MPAGPACHPAAWLPIAVASLAWGWLPLEVLGQREWHVSGPSVTVGRIDAGEGHDLSDVRDATVSTDGRIAVASAGTHDIRLFDVDGRYLRSLGRRGQGPGEFWGAIRCIEKADELLLAFDPALRRLTYFRPDGEVIRVETLAYPDRLAGSVIQCPFTDGSHLVSRSTFWEGQGRAVNRAQSDIVHFLRFDQTRLDTILAREVRAITVTHEEEGQRATLRANLPFAPPLLQARDRSSFAVGYGDPEGVEIFDSTGALQAVIRPSGTPRPVERRDRAAYRRWYLEEGGSDGMRPLRELVLDAAPWQETVPLLDRLVLDETGLVWMGAYTLQGETRVWQVHARDGVEVARVALPRKLDVFEIGADYVLGRMTGDFDEHLVVRFDLERR